MTEPMLDSAEMVITVISLVMKIIAAGLILFMVAQLAISYHVNRGRQFVQIIDGDSMMEQLRDPEYSSPIKLMCCYVLLLAIGFAFGAVAVYERWSILPPSALASFDGWLRTPNTDATVMPAQDILTRPRSTRTSNARQSS